MKFNRVPTGYGWQWYRMSWEAIEGARPFFFAVGLFLFVLEMIGQVPIGGLILGFVDPLAMAGAYQVARNWDKSRKLDISAVFVAVTNNKLFLRLLPLCFVTMGLGLIRVVLSIMPIRGWLSWMSVLLLQLVYIALLLVSVPLIQFHSQDWQKAIKNSTQAFWENFGAVFVACVLSLAFIALSFMTLGVGFILFLPTMAYFFYQVYKTVVPEPA